MYAEARAVVQFIFLRRLRNQSFCDLAAGGLPRGLGRVPKPSCEHDIFDKENKGRKGTAGNVSKTEGFRTEWL